MEQAKDKVWLSYTSQVLTSQQQEAQQDVRIQTDGLGMWLKTFPTFKNKLMVHALITE